MWLLVSLALAGLALKIWAAHRLRQFWYIPGASILLLFVTVTYAQTLLELYAYYVRYGEYDFNVNLLKLYFILVLATTMHLPCIIEVLVSQRICLVKALTLFSSWSIFSTLILSTNWFIEGIQALPYIYTRIPGPYYGIIPVVAIITIIYSVMQLLNTIHSTQDELKKIKACNILVGLVLPIVIVLIVTLLMRVNIPVNMAGVLPLSIGILIFVLAEQFNDVHIFDIRTIIPFTNKWYQLWKQTRHIHTVSVDPSYCRGLIDEYTDSLIEAADKVCNNQRDVATYIGVSQSTVSRRARKVQQTRQQI